MVGAVILSRAVAAADPELSERILAAAREQAAPPYEGDRRGRVVADLDERVRHDQSERLYPARHRTRVVRPSPTAVAAVRASRVTVAICPAVRGASGSSATTCSTRGSRGPCPGSSTRSTSTSNSPFTTTG